MAEICQIFRCFFGTFKIIKKTFWNQLTFISHISPGEGYIFITVTKPGGTRVNVFFFLYLQHAQCTYSHYPLCIEVHSRVHKSRYSPNTVIQCVRLAPFFILAVLFWTGLVQKSDNLQYNTLVCWVAGMNDSSTNHQVFQVLFFFHNFLQNSLQKLFQFISFIFL